MIICRGRTVVFPALIGVAVGVWLQAATTDLDTALNRFWSAKNPSAAAKATGQIVKSGAAFDDLYARFQQGRPYSKDVPSGLIEGRRAGMAGEFNYIVEVPATYDPSRKYQVRIQLHGGVGRDKSAPRRPGGIGRLAGAEQIYILPQAWNEAPWWSESQLENLRAILDSVKRTYNVDENRVVIAGVSDGATGAYYVAMRDPTAYASFLPLNGSIVVLRNDAIGVRGDLFPTNLRNRPLFIVNGGKDPLYPSPSVEPYIEHMRAGGVTLIYKPHSDAGHDTSWWPQEKDAFETFVREHPRVPLPDRLTWETSDTRAWNRFAWLVVDSVGSRPDDTRDLIDLNDFAPPRALDFGIRMNGSKVERVINGSSAHRVGLKAGDTLMRIDDRPIGSGNDILAAFQAHAVGSSIRLGVTRGGKPLELTGTFAPTPVQADASTTLFQHHSRSGRIDLQRTGNTVEITSRGVAELTLLISANQFDFAKPVRVKTNGRIAFEGTIEKNVATLLKWAARDNDRTMLFAAELKIKIR